MSLVETLQMIVQDFMHLLTLIAFCMLVFISYMLYLVLSALNGILSESESQKNFMSSLDRRHASAPEQLQEIIKGSSYQIESLHSQQNLLEKIQEYSKKQTDILSHISSTQGIWDGEILESLQKQEALLKQLLKAQNKK